MRYLNFTFLEEDAERQEILIASLSDFGFEGFEQKEKIIEAFIPISGFKKETFDEMINSLESLFPVSFTHATVDDKNWNEEWESNFKPIIISNEIFVRASFHNPNPAFRFEIVIDPKMSFGTGHHATTAMMMELMLNENFIGKEILDFGCGTGILSILASKMDCMKLVAIDNDLNAIENCSENFQLNQIDNFELIHDDKINVSKSFNIIIANITRDIILKNFSAFNQLLIPGGILFTSGFLIQDEELILSGAERNGFSLKKQRREGDWRACLFLKK